MTVPRKVGQVPIYYNTMPTGRPGRYFQSNAEPLWPFGHGFSYTSFEYSNLNLNVESGESAIASIDISNTGQVKGDEVIQLYVRDEYASVARPAMELKRFQRITLEPGEKKTIEFKLEKDAFAFFNAPTDSWIVEPGSFEIMIGSSSGDIRSKGKLELK